MKKYPFNAGWLFCKVGQEADKRLVTLPHDAMLAEKRSTTSSGGAHISWFEGGDYAYEKTFTYENGAVDGAPLPPGGSALLEFEGVYRNAEVYLNGEKIAERPYGYTNFYVDLTASLVEGENRLRVLARNAKQPNSRWYTGSGIYRPVNLYILPEKHIPLNGVRIRTTDHVRPQVEITVQTGFPGQVAVEIRKKGEEKVLYRAGGASDGSLVLSVPMPGATLWSPQTPALYVCRALFEGDEMDVVFGVRTLECTAEKGFCLNGERVILRGACIHHDNGLLGAITDPFAERRRVRLLKQAGYNAIRSAHNPCAKALLEACDEEGMLLMDEYVDMWYIHKTRYDYVDDFERWWRQDLSDLVDKDYNHPSVIMYCIGNEVAETSQTRGIELTGQMTRFMHSLDDTRKVTCGINIFFNFLFSMGFGVYSDAKAEKAAKSTDVKNSAGSEFYNNLAGLAGAPFMKFGATLHGSDVKTRDAFAQMDVAGYNYGIRRYPQGLCQIPAAHHPRHGDLLRRHIRLLGDGEETPRPHRRFRLGRHGLHRRGRHRRLGIQGLRARLRPRRGLDHRRLRPHRHHRQGGGQGRGALHARGLWPGRHRHGRGACGAGKAPAFALGMEVLQRPRLLELRGHGGRAGHGGSLHPRAPGGAVSERAKGGREKAGQELPHRL